MNRQPVRGDVISIGGVERLCVDSSHESLGEGKFAATFSTIGRDDFSVPNAKVKKYCVAGFAAVVGAEMVRLADITFHEQLRLKGKRGAISAR